jgi:protein-S-isoprenylcysteine O-methyltransferase Ste14
MRSASEINCSAWEGWSSISSESISIGSGSCKLTGPAFKELRRSSLFLSSSSLIEPKISVRPRLFSTGGFRRTSGTRGTLGLRALVPFDSGLATFAFLSVLSLFYFLIFLGLLRLMISEIKSSVSVSLSTAGLGCWLMGARAFREKNKSLLISLPADGVYSLITFAYYQNGCGLVGVIRWWGSVWLRR